MPHRLRGHSILGVFNTTARRSSAEEEDLNFSISAELRGLTATNKLLRACCARSMLRCFNKTWSASTNSRPGSSNVPSLSRGIAPTASQIFSGAPFKMAKCVASSGNFKDVASSEVKFTFCGISWMLAAIFLTLLKGISNPSCRGYMPRKESTGGSRPSRPSAPCSSQKPALAAATFTATSVGFPLASQDSVFTKVVPWHDKKAMAIWIPASKASRLPSFMASERSVKTPRSLKGEEFRDIFGWKHDMFIFKGTSRVIIVNASVHAPQKSGFTTVWLHGSPKKKPKNKKVTRFKKKHHHSSIWCLMNSSFPCLCLKSICWRLRPGWEKFCRWLVASKSFSICSLCFWVTSLLEKMPPLGERPFLKIHCEQGGKKYGYRYVYRHLNDMYQYIYMYNHRYGIVHSWVCVYMYVFVYVCDSHRCSNTTAFSINKGNPIQQ